MPPKTQTGPASSEALVEIPPFPSEALVEKAPFSIDCDDHADWLLAKLAAFDAEAVLLQAQHDERMKRLASDRQSLSNLFQSQLEAYVVQKIKRDRAGRKSVLFPHGTCNLRTVPAGLRISDTAAAIAFAKTARPEVVRTVETLDSTAYRQWAESRLHNDGEMIPGTDWVPDRESFSIRFGSGK